MYNITKKEKIKAFLKYEFFDTTPKKLTIFIVIFQAFIIVTAFSIYLMADDKIQIVVIFEMCASFVTLLATITIETFFYKYNKDGLLYFWFRIVYSMFLFYYCIGYTLLGFCIFESNGASIIKSVLKFNISFSIFMVIFTIIITKVLVDRGFYNRVKKRHYSKEVSVLGAGIIYFCVNILKHSVDSLTLLYLAAGGACLSPYIIVLYLIKIYYLKKYRFKVKYKRDEDGNRVCYIPD